MGWEYTGVVIRDSVKREIAAASQPSTERTAKSTMCCNVSPTVLAEKRVRAMPAKATATWP
jgi:hypothetical protein